MIKEVHVTFSYDSETDSVNDIKCFINGIEKKKTTTTRKSKTKEIVLEDKAIITLESNKIVFNNKCAQEMELSHEDRIVIKYEKFGKENLPIIGKDIAFDEEGSGNKVTKTNTVTYRGKANTVLAEYGTEFEIVPYKDGIWKMNSLNEGIKATPVTLDFGIKKSESLEPSIISDSDEDYEINELTFKF